MPKEVVSIGFTVEQNFRIVKPGNRPGIGIEIDEEVVKSHRFKQEILPRSFYSDGSVRDW